MENNKVKIAPHSKESEMMVLGCMLTSVNSLNVAADALDEHDFYFNEHKTIFQILKNAYKSDKPADIHLVSEELKRQGKLASIGGVAYVSTLAQYAGTSAYIEEYASLVKGKAVLRRMIQAAQVVEKNALEEPEDVHRVLDDAQQLFFNIGQNASPGVGFHIRDLLLGSRIDTGKPFLKELQEKQENFLANGPDKAGITGIPTHFTDLDRIVNGLNKSNLMILAARPAMGKTAMATSIAENVCFVSNIPVGIFSLEMSAQQLLHRMIASQSEVESEKLKTGSLSGLEYQKVVESVRNMQQHTMIIDDQPGLKITDIRARARRMKENYNVGFIVIDYLQLISGSGSNRSIESRQVEISEISRMLKNLARELDIPVLCLAQLSRKVEERQGHRPMMSDLRESGCLTGDALIQDAKTGHFHTIKELAERAEQVPLFVHAVDSELKMGHHRLVKAFYSGRKQVFELKTRTGRRIKASANHPFLQVGGWVPLGDLKIGDRVGLPRKLTLGEASPSLDDNELCLLGHLLGDGCILPNQPYHYTSADEVNIGFVKEAASQLFNIQSRLVRQKNWFHVYLSSPVRLTHGRYHPITTWFNGLGLQRVRSYEKRLPSAVFRCSDEKVALFLRHLWATDGNISLKKLKGRKDSAAIYYGSTSKSLCVHVQHLLLRLGIQSTLAKCSQGRHRAMYNVQIFGVQDQKKFLSTVGCVGKRGEIIPQLLQQCENISPVPHGDVIPKEVWHTAVKEAKDKHGLGWRQVCSRLNTSYGGASLMKSNISRERMQALNRVMPTPDLKKLAQSEVYWDEIVEITPLGEEDVYDATVEGVHNFVANDIIVHNSIEQDSDVVMFLLRREYYDPMDKPGMAELIVAKNRHGSIGNVQLTYRKEIVRFGNYTPMKGGRPQTEEDPFKDFDE